MATRLTTCTTATRTTTRTTAGTTTRVLGIGAAILLSVGVSGCQWVESGESSGFEIPARLVDDEQADPVLTVEPSTIETGGYDHYVAAAASLGQETCSPRLISDSVPHETHTVTWWRAECGTVVCAGRIETAGRDSYDTGGCIRSEAGGAPGQTAGFDGPYIESSSLLG